MRDTTLAGAVIGRDTLLKQAALVLGGTMFIALAAQVSIPFFPVPMTLQSLAILIVGLTFGARLGAVTLVAYLAEGAMGLPVFANGASAPALLGPSAGFLYGFVLMAWLAGLAAEHGVHHGHHNAATHSTAVCAWMCAAGQVLQGFDFGLYGPSLTLFLDEPSIPSTPDSHFAQTSRSRAPPSA